MDGCVTLDPMATNTQKKKIPADNTTQRVQRGLLGVGALTERIARPILGKRGFASGQVIGRWSEIVGAELAAATAPERIQFERGARTGGTLHLRVASGAAAVLIQPHSQVIIDRVNAYLGMGTVARIKVSQGPLRRITDSKSKLKADPISDNDLVKANEKIGNLESKQVKSALAKLGARLNTRG